MKRGKFVHKHDFGYVLVVAGSYKYTGSPIFNGEAALRAGCDLVTIAGPKRAADIAAIHDPNLITLPLSSKYLSDSDVDIILPELKKNDVLLIGSGVGRMSETFSAVRKLVKSALSLGKKIVIDADGIRAFKDNLDMLASNRSVIVTPNVPEFEFLFGVKLDNTSKRKEIVKEMAKKYSLIILLKGPSDIISDGYEVLVNKTGTPYMTKGGFGDTLAGVVDSLLAQGKSPLDSAFMAAKINGFAGQIVSKARKESMLASDIIEEIGLVRSKLN